jgi:hypothetical protein
MQQVSKIKLTNEYRTDIYLEDNESKPSEKRQKDIHVSIEAGRHPDFDAAFEAVVPWLLKEFELPAKWKESTICKSVSIKRTEAQGLGAVFTLIKSFDNFGGVFCLNTPLMHEDLGETGHDKMPIQIRDCLIKMLDEAHQFMNNGKQAQGQLFDDEKEAA